jgi:hypothetical protein
MEGTLPTCVRSMGMPAIEDDLTRYQQDVDTKLKPSCQVCQSLARDLKACQSLAKDLKACQSLARHKVQRFISRDKRLSLTC